jgi:collagenase-like PrtC family protease
MANYTVATNFDPHLLEAVGKMNQQYPFKVIEVYGSLPNTAVGSGRSASQLPQINHGDLSAHITLAHQYGLKFNYLLNGKVKAMEVELREEVESLLDLGVDSFTVAQEEVVRLLRREFPQAELHLSVIAGVRSEEEIRKYVDLGVNTITLNQHVVNRDFALIERLVRVAPKVDLRLYANVSCLANCPLRNKHYQYLSTQSQNGAEQRKEPDYHIVACALAYLRYPLELLKSPFIRPEDVKEYEQLGIKTFKLSDRREPTSALTNLLQAYLSGEFHGNLFTLLFREGRKWTSHFVSAGLTPPSVPDIVIDNDKLTELDFLRNSFTLKGGALEDFYAETFSQAVKGTEGLKMAHFEEWLDDPSLWS